MKRILALLLLAVCSSYAYSETIRIKNTNIYDDSQGTTVVTQSEREMDVTSVLNDKLRNNKIQNKEGKNQDYIIVPEENNPSKDTIGAYKQIILSSINDPYVIKIKGIKYYMVTNSPDGKYTLNNIVGYGDTKDSLFSSLKALNSDGDSKKLTAKELKDANVRFVKVSKSGRLLVNQPENDFENLIYIDLQTLKESVNNGKIGSFGYFDAYITDKFGDVKKIIGYVSFDSDNELLEMLK